MNLNLKWSSVSQEEKDRIATLQFMRAKKGDTVKIAHSVYAGVSIGELGVVECLHADPRTEEAGYGVTFSKFWPQTFINEAPHYETRVMWFPVDAVEVIPPEEVATLQLAEEKKKKKK